MSREPDQDPGSEAIRQAGRNRLLKILWALFALGWSGFCFFFLWLGAALSSSGSHVDQHFFVSWLLPIAIPVAIYRLMLFINRSGNRTFVSSDDKH